MPSLPKPTTAHNPAILKSTRGPCGWCGAHGRFPAHHLIHRSHQRLDIPENLVTLCPACHSRCHTDREFEGMVAVRCKSIADLRALYALCPAAGLWKVCVACRT